MWPFTKKAQPPLHRHNWEMFFPDPNSMHYEFRCLGCGKTRFDMPTPEEILNG